MSHFTKIKTQIVEQKYLLKALDDLELNYEVGDVKIHGWMLNRAKVEIRVAMNSTNFNVGFVKKDGKYEIIADWYGVKGVNKKDFVNELTQRYSYHVAKDKLEEQDFTLVNEEVTEDKVIHLTLRRMI